MVLGALFGALEIILRIFDALGGLRKIPRGIGGLVAVLFDSVHRALVLAAVVGHGCC